MAASLTLMETYRKLAEWHHNHGQPQQRDRFLVLAADTANNEGREQDAEAIRIRLLRHNPHHLLKPYGSFAQAMNSEDVQHYVADLRRTHPPEAAAQLLEKLRQQTGEASAPPARPSAQGLPPTQPVIDLGPVPRAGPARTDDPPRVYRLHEDPIPAPARPHTRAVPELASQAPGRSPSRVAPEPASVPPRNAGPPRPVASPPAAMPVYTVPPSQPVRSLAPPVLTKEEPGRTWETPTEPENAAGWWMCLILATVLSMGSLVLMGYALVAPLVAGK